MRSRLESTKPLDANVEKDGAREVRYDKDSYDYLFDDLEILGIDKIEYIDDDNKAIIDSARQESTGIAKALAESEMSDEQLEELWSASDLGKYTVGTPTQEKQAVEGQEKNMQPVSELEFQEISDDMDHEDAEMQKKLEEAWQELEGIF